jgi:hypothetical protein
MLGYVVVALQPLGIVQSFIILADFPVSLVVFALAWHHAVLATIWLVVAGTLWWYLLSRLLELAVQWLMRKGEQSSGLNF